jgi:hypothetical protein
MNTIGYSGDQAWVVWDGEQRKSLIRAVFESLEMPHRNLSRIALVAADR